MAASFLIGVFLSVLGSIFSNLGVNIQKFSMNKNALLPKKDQKQYFVQPYWILGFFFVVIGAFGDFSALGFAAQSIVAPVGSLTLVANIFFAHFWLKESLSKNDIIGTSLIITGSVFSVVFGDHFSRNLTLNELLSLFGGIGFIIYAITMAFLIGICTLFIWRLQPLRDNLMDHYKEWDNAINESDSSQLFELDYLIKRSESEYFKPFVGSLHPIYYCCLAGTLGSFTLIFAKCTAELIRTSAAGDNQFIYPITYLILITMIVTIVFETHYLATGLKYFEALFIVPVFQFFFITLGALAGGIYFQEFSRFSLVQSFLFPFGIVVTLFGVYFLSLREVTQKRSRTMSTVDHFSKRSLPV